MSQPLIIDLHLDLAWDALYWNRDLTLTAREGPRSRRGTRSRRSPTTTTPAPAR